MTNNQRYPGNNIHESAIIAEGVAIGRGNTIGPYCLIGLPAEWKGHEKEGQVIIGNNNTITGLVTIDSGAAGSTMIWNGCYIMKGAHIGHDAKIWDGVTISCKAIVGGHTVIKDYVNLGLACVIYQQQTIAEGCMIGACAFVPKKLITKPFKVYAGVPAREIGENSKHPYYTINQKEWPE